MGKAYRFGTVGPYIKDNGLRTKCMARASSYTPARKSMRENLSLTRPLGMESLSGRMERSTRGTG